MIGLSCGDLTSVDAPDLRQPADYVTAAGASALATGAITTFAAAFGGATPSQTVGFNQVMSSGQISDELFITGIGSLGTPRLQWDNRSAIEPSSGGSDLFYNPLHAARINTLTAIRAMEATAPDSSARIAHLFALLGYTEIFFGENFCSGVPLSDLDPDFRPIYGSPLSTQRMYEKALAHFDSALAHASDSVQFARFAMIGKARSLVDLGRFAEAAAAVATVPTSFTFNVTYVTGTLHNGVFASGLQTWYTVPEQEGTNGINWRTANDPRVRLVNRSPALIGVDGATQVWAFVPYQASNAPITLASGVEARLIEAEAALQAGNAGSWLAAHNALRATVSGLAPLSDPGSQIGRVDLHFRERAFWLFLTGHRHGDLRRLVRQYNRNAESVFPTGTWRQGQIYGSATNMAPGPEASRNPNYTACLDRNP
jgi:hypothetical protein